MSDKGITATEGLSQVIGKWPPREHDYVLRMVEQRTKELRQYYRKGTPVEFVLAFYEVFDAALAEVKQGVSCKRGCYFCCRQNVNIYEDEAATIAAYCEEHGIVIPKEYLEQQLKYEWREIAKMEIGWCTFLKNGECSIYPVRPLACRNYHVASAPELCDTVKFPADKGHQVLVSIFTVPEIEASAFSGVMADKGQSKRLPELLLPYSK